MRRVILTLVLGLSAMAWAVGGDMGVGTQPLTDGSEAYPWLIEDLADFDVFANPANAATYWASGVHTKLMTDINLSGRTYTAAVIAPDTDNSQYYFQGVSYSGVFNGMGYVIRHLTIDSSTKSHHGLFGEISEDSLITTLGIENCIINGHHYIGGLAGGCLGRIRNCYTTGSISGLDIDIGGLIGRNSGDIQDCYSTGNVNGNGYSGGIAGSNINTISNCYSTGNIQGGTGNYIGGFVGVTGGSVYNCYSTGNVDGNNYVGGFTGKSSSRIEQCFSRGNVSGSSDVGGLVGYHSGLIISQCYSTGQVSGSTRVGGLIGRGPSFSIYYAFASYWDKETSGRTSSAGGTGLTTEQMKDINTYLAGGWDFVNETSNGTCSYWTMPPNDYPTLSTFYGYTPPELEGNGTLTNPYLIADANDFGTVWYRSSAHYRLIHDIDFAGIGWSIPVVPEFQGTLDGNGYCVRHLTINGNRIFQGFFGKISGGVIENFGIVNGSICGGTWVGSLTGFNNDGAIYNCYATCTVNGEDGVGGLAGTSTGTISHSHSTGDVTGVAQVGGLVGEHGGPNTPKGSIDNCSSTGDICGNGQVGGLVGENYYGHIANSFSSGSVICTPEFIDGSCYNAGGLVGLNCNIVEKCHSASTVQGLLSVGGLVGKNEGWASVIQSFSSGLVTGSSDVGGLIGWNDGCEIDNCYSTGSIVGDEKVGGLVGYSDGYYDDMDYVYRGTVRNSYSIGLVTATGFDVGGLIGKNYRIEHENISNCFWNKDTSGILISAGGILLDDPNMMIQANFVNWDFSDGDGDAADWMMLREREDTPRLAWQAVFAGDVAGLYGVDMADFAEVARNWLQTGCPAGCEDADIDGDGEVGLGDLAVVAGDWMKN